MIASLACVNYVNIFKETDPKNVLSKIKPHIHAKGKDWGEKILEKEAVEKNGGKIRVMKWTPGLSTTKTVEKIVKRHKKAYN